MYLSLRNVSKSFIIIMTYIFYFKKNIRNIQTQNPQVFGGWLREDIHDHIVSCLDKVNVDIASSCTQGDEFFARNGEARPDRELLAGPGGTYLVIISLLR